MLALTCLLPTPVTAQDDIAEAIVNGNSLPPALQYTTQNESQYTTLADITRLLCRVCDSMTSLHCFVCNAPICGACSFDYGFGEGGNTVHRYTVVTSRICFHCNEILHRRYLENDASDASSSSSHPSMPSLIDVFDAEPEDGQNDGLAGFSEFWRTHGPHSASGGDFLELLPGLDKDKLEEKRLRHQRDVYIV